MHSVIKVVILGLMTSACGLSADVKGIVGPDEKVYRGVAVGYTDRTGTIEMSAEDGSHCIGEFRYIGQKTGVGTLRCNDGQSAAIHFNALGIASGYGYGQTSRGGTVKFTYGLDDKEAQLYLGTGPVASDPETNQGGSTGSGFIISSKGHVMTNQHVIEGCNDISVRYPDGLTHPGTVVADDVSNDLAVVLTGVKPDHIAVFNAEPRYRQGEDVVVYGFPYSASNAIARSGSLTSGRISALFGPDDDIRFVQITAPIQPGNSGGPLVNNRGHVIGVVTSSLNALVFIERTGTVPQNVNFAVKDSVAKAFLIANDIPFKEASSGRVMSIADIGAKIKKSVAFIICK